MYLIHNLDDLEDAVDHCQETALLFPEIGSSHSTVGFFTDTKKADALMVAISTYYNNREEVSVESELTSGVTQVRVVYTLTPNEYDECENALSAFSEDVVPLDLNDPKDIAIFDDLMAELDKVLLDYGVADGAGDEAVDKFIDSLISDEVSKIIEDLNKEKEDDR